MLAVFALDSSYSGVHDQSLTGQARGGDDEGAEVTFSLTSGTSSGVVSLDPSGIFDYTPDVHFVGGDGFGFEVSNGTDTASAFVTITITNEAPVADSGSFTVLHDQSYSGMVSATDADADMLTYSIDAAPLHGALSLDPSGTFVYEPDPRFVGGDSFSFEATDGIAADTAFVTMDVTNTAPVADDQTESTPHDQPLSSMVSGWDPDGDFPLTYALAAGPWQGGYVTLEADGSFTFEPLPGYVGADGFDFSVSDSIASDIGTVTINVTNEAPTASPPERFIHWTRDPNPTEVSLWDIFEDPDDPDGDLTFSATSSDPAVTVTVDSATGQLWISSSTGDPVQTAIELTATDPQGGSVTSSSETWSIDLQGMVVEERYWGDETWHLAQDEIWSSDEHRWSTTVVPAGAEQYVDWIEWRAEPWEGQSIPNGTGSWFADSSASEPAYGSPEPGDWFIYPVAFFQAKEANGQGERWKGFRITSVEWEGVDPGDSFTNFADLGLERSTIFPERNNPPGTANSQIHDKVKVTVTIEPAVPQDIPDEELPQIALKLFDPDNLLVGGADPNDPDANTAMPGDNVKDGSLDNSGNPLPAFGISPATATLTLAQGTASQSYEFTITRPQPGNDWIAVANRRSSALESLDFLDDGLTLAYEFEGQTRIVPSNYHTRILTVWRTLWVESDHMVAPGPNDGPFTGDPDCMGCDDDPNTLPTNPTISNLRTLLFDAFVMVWNAPGDLDTQDTMAFQHNLINTTVPAGVRNVDSSKYYWAVHMMGSYEFHPDFDNDKVDPQTNLDTNDEDWLAGWSEHEGGDDPTNFVFYETARDVWAEPELPGMVPLATLLDRISAHEALHRFFGWHANIAAGQTPGAADEGIMDPTVLMTAPSVTLTDRQIKTILAKGWPK